MFEEIQSIIAFNKKLRSVYAKLLLLEKHPKKVSQITLAKKDYVAICNEIKEYKETMRLTYKGILVLKGN